MSDQGQQMQSLEFQRSQELSAAGYESGAVNGLTMLTLNGGGDRHCNSCGSVKRRSPSSSSLWEDQPTAKKLTFQQPSSSAAADHHSRSFTKLPLPIASPIFPAPSAYNSLPVLRRCTSDPVSSPGTNPAGQFLNPISPENANNAALAAAAATWMPPIPPALCRSFSDLTPSPAKQSMAKTFSTSPNSSEIDSTKGESPDSKRLKRMRTRMREMSQWWDEVLREDDDDDSAPEVHNNNTSKDDDFDTENEESVSVERTGECLVINFRCPCSKGYQILLSGKNCYYKLM